jgi:hypothetical protein
MPCSCSHPIFTNETAMPRLRCRGVLGVFPSSPSLTAESGIAPHDKVFYYSIDIMEEYDGAFLYAHGHVGRSREGGAHIWPHCPRTFACCIRNP